MAAEILAWASAPAFEATDEPYLIVDRGYRICAVNAAYEAATNHPRKVLLGERMFDVFPDNPEAPDANGVARLSESFEFVLSRGARHRMSLQRYDVRDRAKPHRFLYKVWAPTNSPITDERGRTTAILHHVKDMTAFVPAPTPTADAAAVLALAARDGEAPADRWTRLAVALHHEREVSDSLRRQVDTLREALETNRQISVAVGLLMAATGLDRAGAFQLLVRRSQTSHRKLRDVATDLVREHEAR